MSRRKRNLLATGAAAFSAIAISAGAQASPAEKILVCHGTASADQPYVLISVSENALAGHILGEAGHGPNNAPDFLPDAGAVDCSTGQ